MCGPTKAPQVVQSSPEQDQKKAEAKATQKSNAELALRRKRLQENSLLTVGASGTTPLAKTPDTLLGPLDIGTPPAQRKNPKLGSNRLITIAGAMGADTPLTRLGS